MAPSPPEAISTLTKGAVGFTVVWASGALILQANKWETLGKPLQLNQLGDYAAGAAAPIAFLWLVMGFWQQGREMRAQAMELNASVRAQLAIADTARAQQALEVCREAREEIERMQRSTPLLEVYGVKSQVGNFRKLQLKFSFLNLGLDLMQVKAVLIFGGLREVEVMYTDMLKRGASVDGSAIYGEREGALLRVTFTDEMQRKGKMTFDVQIADNDHRLGLSHRPFESVTP